MNTGDFFSDLLIGQSVRAVIRGCVVKGAL